MASYGHLDVVYRLGEISGRPSPSPANKTFHYPQALQAIASGVKGVATASSTPDTRMMHMERSAALAEALLDFRTVVEPGVFKKAE